MFRVVVVAGVSLVACGSDDTTGTTDGGGVPSSTNPPEPRDSAADAPADAGGGADAPADAIDEMPLIK